MPKTVALVKVRQAKNVNLRRRFVFTVAHNVRLLSAAAELAVQILILCSKVNNLFVSPTVVLQPLLRKANVVCCLLGHLIVFNLKHLFK